jgi:hypothetical protein
VDQDQAGQDEHIEDLAVDGWPGSSGTRSSPSESTTRPSTSART